MPAPARRTSPPAAGCTCSARRAWQPLVTRWRCRPQLFDWGEGQVTYLQVAADGALTRYRLLPDGPASEQGEARVAAHDRLRYEDGAPVRLDLDFGGRIGRLKLAIADWDGDGLPDVLVARSGTQPVGANPYKKSTVFLLRNRGAPGRPRFARPEPILLDAGSPALFGGHSCVPAPCSLSPAPGDTGAPLGYTGAIPSRPARRLRERARLRLPAGLHRRQGDGGRPPGAGLSRRRPRCWRPARPQGRIRPDNAAQSVYAGPGGATPGAPQGG